MREDPVRKGLLFAGTENAVWVSFDDGDHWQSLQLNLPHTSMRDLWIHDDDLIVATHGRSFWILDDITPLRQAVDVAANTAHLYKPAAAWRVRRDTYTDTPPPPDEPAGANPPDGAVIDYFLPDAAGGPVTLEILDDQGKVVRRYSSTDKPEATQEELEKQAIPLYWIRPFRRLSTEAGMHRWVWDLHYATPRSARHEFPISAIPHDTPRQPLGPTALPGNYTVRLSVAGKSQTASLFVRMDPRVKTSPAGLGTKFQAEMKLVSLVSESSKAIFEAASIREQLGKMQALTGAIKDARESFEKGLDTLTGAPGGLPTASSEQTTLSRFNSAVTGLYGQIWQADAQPTISQQEALKTVEQDAGILTQWKKFISSDLPALNGALREGKIPEIAIGKDIAGVELESDDEE